MISIQECSLTSPGRLVSIASVDWPSRSAESDLDDLHDASRSVRAVPTQGFVGLTETRYLEWSNPGHYGDCTTPAVAVDYRNAAVLRLR